MSSCFVAYAVNPKQVWSVYGSNDRILLELLSKKYKKRLNQLTELYRETSSKAPDAPTMLAGFIAGTPPHNAWVAHNIDVILLLMEYFGGEQLACDVLDRVNADFVEEVQAAIKSTGSSFDLWRLVSSNPPEHIPTRPVYPGAPNPPGTWGFLDPAAVIELAATLAKVTLPGDTGEHISGALEDLRTWCTAAVARGTGLAVLYST